MPMAIELQVLRKIKPGAAFRYSSDTGQVSCTEPSLAVMIRHRSVMRAVCWGRWQI
jgi:hypothetical protein